MNRGSEGASKGPELSIFPVSATYWAGLGPFLGLHVSYVFKCFPVVPTRDWHVFE